MKIAHVCLSNYYIDNFSYQENELISCHVAKGHDVLVIASMETLSQENELNYLLPKTYHGADGARVVRLPYATWAPTKIMRKLRFYRGLRDALDQFVPDAILFHGSGAGELLNVASYVRTNPRTIFHIDSHTLYVNSGRTLLSREVLHKRFYGPILRRALRQTGKLLCVIHEAMDFAEDVYSVPREQLELFPLGGRPIGDTEYAERRARGRARLNLKLDDIALVQCGKQNRSKKLIETLNAFANTATPPVRLFIAGMLVEDIKTEAETRIKRDKRITNLGWCDTDTLTDILCAADLYLQPGTPSVTMQHSLCCRCAVVLNDTVSHRYHVGNNGWLLSDRLSIEQALHAAFQKDLLSMGMLSYKFACDNLDYEYISDRVLKR